LVLFNVGDVCFLPSSSTLHNFLSLSVMTLVHIVSDIMDVNPDTSPALVSIADVLTITGLKRTTLYSRMEGLGIKPTKQGRNSFITEDELHTLQALHEHLGKGGMIADFGVVGDDSETRTSATQLTVSPPGTTIPPLVQALEMVAEIMDMAPRPTAAGELREKLQFLDEAVGRAWLIPSGELAAVIPGASQFERYGFTFTHAAKQGREWLWRVSKTV